MSIINTILLEEKQSAEAKAKKLNKIGTAIGAGLGAGAGTGMYAHDFIRKGYPSYPHEKALYFGGPTLLGAAAGRLAAGGYGKGIKDAKEGKEKKKYRKTKGFLAGAGIGALSGIPGAENSAAARMAIGGLLGGTVGAIRGHLRNKGYDDYKKETESKKKKK